MNDAGPPGASSNGFNENLTLFQNGQCGMWIDATVAASFVTNPDDSKVADSVGFALAPDNGLGKRSNWLWAWSLASRPAPSRRRTAKKFVAWATSKDYLEIVAENEGWANVPPGTRTSLYENPEYQEVPFAEMTLESINSAEPEGALGAGSAVRRRPVRGHPRVPGHRHRGRPAVLGGPRRLRPASRTR